MAVTGGEKRDPEPASHIPESSPNPEGTTPEQEARREFGERLRGLLQAYKDTLNTVKDLPVVVWVPWDRKSLPISLADLPSESSFKTSSCLGVRTGAPLLPREGASLWRRAV